ncbi:MAG: TolC family protein [Pseudomonadota bacterium]
MSGVRTVLLSLVLVGALAGCTILGPSYEAQDPVAIGDVAVDAGASYDAGAPVADWWRLFDDAQLTRLVEEGLAANRTLDAAYAAVNAARAQFGLARLDRIPFDTVGASYLASRQGSAVFSAGIGAEAGDPFPTTDISDVNVSAQWEVDLFGRVTRTINIAEASLEETQADLLDLQALIAADIANAYVTLRGLEAQRAVARENVANQEDTVRLTEATRDAGRGTDLDVERARAQLATTRSLIPSLSASIVETRAGLAVLTGRTPAELVDALGEAGAPLPGVAGSIAIGDPAALLRRRPDVAARERALRAATERIGLNMAEAFPRVDLTGRVGFQAVEFENQFGPNALNFAYGPSISWSLTNLLRARQTVRAARQSALGAFAVYEETVLAALAEAETAFAAQALAQARLVDLREAKRASAEASRLARLRYENGATDFLIVLDAERRELEAAEGLAAAETAAAQAQVAVFRALRAGPTDPDVSAE